MGGGELCHDTKPSCRKNEERNAWDQSFAKLYPHTQYTYGWGLSIVGGSCPPLPPYVSITALLTHIMQAMELLSSQDPAEQLEASVVVTSQLSDSTNDRTAPLLPSDIQTANIIIDQVINILEENTGAMAGSGEDEVCVYVALALAHPCPESPFLCQSTPSANPPVLPNPLSMKTPHSSPSYATPRPPNPPELPFLDPMQTPRPPNPPEPPFLCNPPDLPTPQSPPSYATPQTSQPPRAPLPRSYANPQTSQPPRAPLPMQTPRPPNPPELPLDPMQTPRPPNPPELPFLCNPQASQPPRAPLPRSYANPQASQPPRSRAPLPMQTPSPPNLPELPFLCKPTRPDHLRLPESLSYVHYRLSKKHIVNFGCIFLPQNIVNIFNSLLDTNNTIGWNNLRNVSHSEAYAS